MPTYKVQNEHGEELIVVTGDREPCKLRMNNGLHEFDPVSGFAKHSADASRSNTATVYKAVALLPDVTIPPTTIHEHDRNGVHYSVHHGAARLPDGTWIRHL